ncbi:SDR family NAD(P)-dependent oxidoreductase [Mycobacterium sp. SMC-21]|jgi:short-subunit dehydrogenase|uniref:SDR family NAD(P)-dependent oxidoreductase n=1 Tax=Mycobacteriaceae TaxID=1762 RepID=UPI000F9767D6|nr:SDR family NAD(P)-dependent oxidoreductase [Mycolicibacterium sp.]RUP28143.1 MAG: SDR family NAD(P)-dependent oxidoreductase [Mycolicibacterium sp.]
MTFESKYGPWALVAGASDGVGAAFAEALAERGLNVVLVARRQSALDEVARGIADRTGVQTRTLVVDLSAPEASRAIADATHDLQIGFLAYCAGADPTFRPFLETPIEVSESLVQRNCVTLMQLCHQFAPRMVERGTGGIVIFGSGAGLVGGPNMVAYGPSKAFDMILAEALWSELNPKGIDVIGLILGKTDTPALRQLEFERGQLASLTAIPNGADTVDSVVAEAFANLTDGPTVFVGDQMRTAVTMLGQVSRNDAVRSMAMASAASMGDALSTAI